MRFTSIRQKASLSILAISLVAFFMVGIGWQSMRVSEASLSEFESETLPEISTSLTLAEGVAQLAAIAPYTAGSGRPFQLQTESERIHRRILELRGVADSLTDSVFQRDIDERLDDLQTTLEELVALVREELYLREDSLAQQFRIRQLPLNDDAAASVNSQQGLVWLLQLLESPSLVPESMLKSLKLSEQNEQVASIAEDLLMAHRRLNQIQERKNYLLISIRAKSEQLSKQVSDFVGGLQKKVSRQRQEVSTFVARGQNWIIGISVFLLLGLTRLYWYSQRMTKDLGVVTNDMEQLSLGRVDSKHTGIRRKDEIGTLADTFEVFRRDALRRLEVTAELSEQKRLLETIFDNMNDGLSVFSSKGTLIAWNSGYQKLFDLSDDDLSVGMSIDEVQSLINQGQHKNLNLENQQVHMEEVNVSRHLRFQSFERHFDSGKIIEFRSKPMPEGGFVTLYTDLTERKSVESQLRQAQKMEMLGQLTGGVAHDFNNLLAAIMGNLQMLSDSRPQTTDQARYIERALVVSEKSSNLVQRLLAFSRRQQLFPVSIAIDDLIEGMLDLVEYSVGSHIVVESDLQCPDVVSLIDPSQLENALLNLSLNSASAMPDGGRLAFSTKLCTLPDSDVPAIRIRVEDSGEGIAEEVIGRIFEPFFTTKPVGKGSGLGLSMIYGFVKQSGGEIKVTSEKGKWTRVCLFLPQQMAPITMLSEEKETQQDIIVLPEFSLVWLVEDDEEVCRVMREQLEKMGFMVQTFDCAESVMNALCKAIVPDAIVSDVNLAGTMSGVELAHSLNSDSFGFTGPILLMSGLPRDELKQKYQLKDDDLFISKPFTIKELSGIFQVEY
ncbi:hybrid sensor histidine kinase/response regulator [Marinomonas sp. A3A]|jgi:PAS domain S-box-containing protein|uniref:PAS-domain containing protein n=1 Tax=Marinomonas sp. A3A TaxID=2065312 RepID=UPI001BB39AC0|nr:PAS-domain containing protein [Marinomonas sp. A3A]QUX93545.1 hybrid sensor histidine kinase/response regulator [Marinomonas sp. A3A]